MDRPRPAIILLVLIIVTISSIMIIKASIADQYYLLSNSAPTGALKIEYLKKAIGLDPLNSEYHRMFANSIHDSELAISEYKKAITLKPADGKYHFQLASLYAKIGREFEAEEALKRAKVCTSAEYDLYLGYLYLSEGKIEEMVPYLKRMMALNSRDEVSLKEIWNEVLNRTNDYKLLTRITIEDVWVHRWLGDYLYERDQWEPAYEEYGKASALEPKNAYILFMLNISRYKLGMEKDSLSSQFDYALSVGGIDNPNIYESLGWRYYRFDLIKEAVALWNKALEIDPKRGGSHLGIASVLAREGKWLEAEEHYHLALLYAPSDSQYRQWVGAYYLSRGMTLEALGYYQEAVRLNPYNIGALYSIAGCYKGLNNLTEAIKTYEKMLRLEPNYLNGKARVEYEELLSAARGGFK